MDNYWLRGPDSNRRPIGYTYLSLSRESGLSHHPIPIGTDVGRYLKDYCWAHLLVSEPSEDLYPILGLAADYRVSLEM